MMELRLHLILVDHLYHWTQLIFPSLVKWETVMVFVCVKMANPFFGGAMYMGNKD